MQIYGLQKLSLLDYPGKIAATVFTGGCNLRCPFCHNASLVTNLAARAEIPQEEVFTFLENRRGKLDGVCISGGEPLLQPDIAAFIQRVRAMGFLVKLDTNGTFPQRLQQLLAAGMLDYVAMDVKSSPAAYAAAVGLADFDTAPVLQSIALLKQSGVPHEFRTTLVKGLHTEEDVVQIGELLQGAQTYALQNFQDSGDLVGFSQAQDTVQMQAFSAQELAHFAQILRPFIKTVSVRD